MGDSTSSEWHDDRSQAGLRIRTPRLSDHQASLVAASVRDSALEARAVRTHRDVLRAVSSAARRLADPSDSMGTEAELLLTSGLGWSRKAAREAFSRM